jgi:hypothetical protein
MQQSSVPPSAPPLSPSEAERLAVLHGFEVLDTSPESEFDDIAKAAAYIFQAPIALISLTISVVTPPA